MSSTRLIAGLTALLPHVLLAQAPAVTAVQNLYSGEAKLAPGLIAKVYYSPITPADLEHQAPGFGSLSHETVFIRVGTYSALVQSVTRDSNGGGIATVLLPRELTPGAISLFLTTRLGTSAPFRIQLDAHAPGLRTPWINCENGQQIAFFNAVGLGPTNPPLPSFGYPPLGQKFPTATTSTATVGGLPAEVLGSYGTPFGDYYGSIRIPSDVPEGLQSVVLRVDGAVSNSVNVIAGTQNSLAVPRGSLALPELIQAAPESIVTASSCTSSLGSVNLSASPKDPPSELGGIIVTVTDSAGVARPAPIFSVSPKQVKYLVPAGTANGRAEVIITSEGSVVSKSPLDIDTVQPGVFWSTAYLIRARDGRQTVEPLRAEPTGWSPTVIDLGPATDEVYLVVYATGLRHRSLQGTVYLDVDFCEASRPCQGGPVQYAEPDSQYAGVEQLNVRLIRWPQGRTGQEDGVRVRFLVDGKPTNELYVAFYQH